MKKLVVVFVLLLIILMVNCAEKVTKYNPAFNSYSKDGIYFEYPNYAKVKESRKNFKNIYYSSYTVSHKDSFVIFQVFNRMANPKAITRVFFKNYRKTMRSMKFKFISSSEKKPSRYINIRHRQRRYVSLNYYGKGGLFQYSNGQRYYLFTMSFNYKGKLYNFITFDRHKQRSTLKGVLSSFTITN